MITTTTVVSKLRLSLRCTSKKDSTSFAKIRPISEIFPEQNPALQKFFRVGGTIFRFVVRGIAALLKFTVQVRTVRTLNVFLWRRVVALKATKIVCAQSACVPQVTPHFFFSREKKKYQKIILFQRFTFTDGKNNSECWYKTSEECLRCADQNVPLMVFAAISLGGLTVFLVFPNKSGAKIAIAIEVVVLLVFVVAGQGESWLPLFCLGVVLVMVCIALEITDFFGKKKAQLFLEI